MHTYIDVRYGIIIIFNIINIVIMVYYITDHVVIGVVRPVCVIGTFPGKFPALIMKFHSKTPQSQLYSTRYMIVLLN